jgi:hypothetical protein
MPDVFAEVSVPELDTECRGDRLAKAAKVKQENIIF